MNHTDMAADIDSFLAKYQPDIVAQMQAARVWVKQHVPRGYEVVYDNYNALVFAFGASLRTSELVVSVAGYPKWVTIFFAHGSTLPDPEGLLTGTGKSIRGLRLESAATLERAAVGRLLEQALAEHAQAFREAPVLSTVVKSVSAKQRPRKPAPR